MKGLKRGFDGRWRKAKPTGEGDSCGFGAENRMERTNWTLLCGASHCCSFECITGVKCGVQDGHVGCGGGNRQRRRTAVAEAFRSFKRAADGRGDIETQECIVLFPIGLNIGRRRERGGRQAAGAGGRRLPVRPSVRRVSGRTDEHRLLAPIPILPSIRSSARVGPYPHGEHKMEKIERR